MAIGGSVIPAVDVTQHTFHLKVLVKIVLRSFNTYIAPFAFPDNNVLQ